MTEDLEVLVRSRYSGARGLLWLVAIVLLAVPASGATLYLGLAADMTVGGIRYVSELEVANRTQGPQVFRYTFIPTSRSANAFTTVDGTASVSPGATQTFRGLAPSNQTGMLKIEADGGLVITGRLVPRSGGIDGVATQVPVVSSGVAGGQTYHLQGLGRSANRVTSLGIVNLSSGLNRCTIDLFNTSGQQIIRTATLDLIAFSQSFWSDVFDVVGRPSVPLGRLEITCAEPSHAFGLLLDRTRTSASLIDLAATGDGTPPIDDGPPPDDPPVVPPPGDCPNDGSLCFEERGLFHRPTQGNTTFQRNYSPPRGAYSKVRLRMTVRLSNWYRPEPDGVHNFFWLDAGVWRGGTLGYANARGPRRNKVRNLVFAGSEGKNERDANRALVPGTTYIINYVLDTDINRAVFTLDNLNGARVVTLTHQVLLNRINIDGNGLILWTGNRLGPGDAPEVPSLGWEYRDAQIILTP